MPGSRRAVPMQDRRVFTCARGVLHARAAHARDYLPRAEPGAEARASRQDCLGASWAGSQGGQGQEFLGVRECLAHIAVHRSQPGNPARGSLEAVRRDSQGRCRSSKRIFSGSEVSVWCTAVISGYPSFSVCIKDQLLSCTVIPQRIGWLTRSQSTTENSILSSLIVVVGLIQFG